MLHKVIQCDACHDHLMFDDDIRHPPLGWVTIGASGSFVLQDAAGLKMARMAVRSARKSFKMNKEMEREFKQYTDELLPEAKITPIRVNVALCPDCSQKPGLLLDLLRPMLLGAAGIDHTISAPDTPE